MATVDPTSQVKLHNVGREEFWSLYHAATILFGSHLSVWVQGAFVDPESGKSLDMEEGLFQINTREYYYMYAFPTLVRGTQMLLEIPEVIKQVLFQAKYSIGPIIKGKEV